MGGRRTARQSTERTIRGLIFAGFNRRVFALDRYTGEIVWKWKAPEGTGFVTVMLDDDRLIVSVNGYMYCLDPLYGQVVWNNPLKGFGVGVTSLTSVRGSVSGAEAAAAAARQQQQAAAAAAAT